MLYIECILIEYKLNSQGIFQEVIMSFLIASSLEESRSIGFPSSLCGTLKMYKAIDNHESRPPVWYLKEGKSYLIENSSGKSEVA